jgi:hypothetical protein
MMMPFICSCRNKKYIVYLVPVFCHTHVGLETFYEGEGDEMLPGCRVVHVLAARSYSLSPITSPLWRSRASHLLALVTVSKLEGRVIKGEGEASL